MANNEGPKIVDLAPKNEMRAASDALRRQMPDLLASVGLIARLRRAQYLAYVEAGFTPQQALELCKGIG